MGRISNKLVLVTFLFIVENICIFFYLNKDLVHKHTQSGWHDAPSISFVCRTYGERGSEVFNMFLTSFLLFWPSDKWPNVDVNIVMDSESSLDHQMGTVLAHMPPYPNIYYEKKPIEKTFCTDWQREGYARQQYSNFYADLQSKHDYIAIVDTDMFAAAQIMPEDFFIKGKPRMLGYNACCTGWLESIQEAIGTEPIGEFMTGISLPMVIKRSHFKPMRNHITQRMKAKNFEEAFYLIC